MEISLHTYIILNVVGLSMYAIFSKCYKRYHEYSVVSQYEDSQEEASFLYDNEKDPLV